MCVYVCVHASVSEYIYSHTSKRVSLAGVCVSICMWALEYSMRTLFTFDYMSIGVKAYINEYKCVLR